MSTTPVERQSPGEAVGGLLAATSIFVSVASIVFHPLRLVLLSIVLALLATAIGGRHSRLAGIAVAIGTVAFILGMTVAVTADRPLW